MKKIKIIAILCAAVFSLLLAGCLSTKEGSKPVNDISVPEDTIDWKGHDVGKQFPAWLDPFVDNDKAALKKVLGIDKDAVVFLVQHIGDNLDFLQTWADQCSAREQVASAVKTITIANVDKTYIFSLIAYSAPTFLKGSIGALLFEQSSEKFLEEFLEEVTNIMQIDGCTMYIMQIDGCTTYLRLSDLFDGSRGIKCIELNGDYITSITYFEENDHVVRCDISAMYIPLDYLRKEADFWTRTRRLKDGIKKAQGSDDYEYKITYYAVYSMDAKIFSNLLNAAEDEFGNDEESAELRALLTE